MRSPLISVVIPTAGRPQYLPTAVWSALDDLGDAVEVIVVPNGSDQSWKESLRPFRADKRVRVEPIEKAHANAARNHGIRLAKGTYVRFLDDDDFLYPGATTHQCRLLEESRADICSGAVHIVTDGNVVFGSRTPPATSDFVGSVLAPGHVSLPTAHVYRRSAISEISWDETVSLAQDKHWLYRLCTLGDWAWVRTDFVVGAWRHHDGLRISGQIRISAQSKVWSLLLLEAILELHSQGRLSARRSAAASSALWLMICKNYFLSPKYWDSVMKRTKALFPETNPNLTLYRIPWTRRIPPRIVLVSTIPVQIARHQIKVFMSRFGIRNYAIKP